MSDATVFPTSFPTKTVLQPLLNIKGASDAVSLNTRGPAQVAPVRYVADSVSDSSIMFQNIVPPNTRTVIQKELLLTYKVLIGFTWKGTPDLYLQANTASIGFPFLAGTDPLEYKKQGWILRDDGAASQLTPNGWIYPARDSVPVEGNITSSTQFGSSRPAGLNFRSTPFNQTCNNLDVKINGQATSINPSDFADIYPYITDPSENGLYTSSCPFYQASSFQSHVGVGGGENLGTPFALSNSGLSFRGDMPSRYAPVIRVVSLQFADNSTNPIAGGSIGFNIIYEAEITEPLLIPPFSSGEVFTEAGLTRVMTLSVQANLGNLMKMIIADSTLPFYTGVCPPPYTAVTNANNMQDYGFYNFQITISNSVTLPAVAFTNGVGVYNLPGASAPRPDLPFLTLLYASLDAATADGEPAIVVYENDLMQQWTTPLTGIPVLANVGVPAGLYDLGQTTWSCTSSALRLPSMPELIYVYAKLSKAVMNDPKRNYMYQNAFLTITGMQISFMDRTGLGVTYDQLGCYRMAVKNGYRGTYKQWKEMAGSILIINTAEDLCLSPTEAPGQNVYSTFQIKVDGNLRNIAYAAGIMSNGTLAQSKVNWTAPISPLDYELVVTTVIPGKCAIGAGQATFMTEGPSAATLFEETKAGIKVDTKDTGTAGGSISGGGFKSRTSGLRGIWKTVKSGANWAINQARSHPDIVQDVVSKVLDAVQPMIADDDGGEPAGEGFGGRKRRTRLGY